MLGRPVKANSRNNCRLVSAHRTGKEKREGMRERMRRENERERMRRETERERERAFVWKGWESMFVFAVVQF